MYFAWDIFAWVVFCVGCILREMFFFCVGRILRGKSFVLDIVL